MANRLANLIASVVILLMAIGTVFVFSAGVDVRHDFELNNFYKYPAFRQLLYFPAAVIVLYLFSVIDYRKYSLDKGWLRSAIPYALFASIVLLILVLLPGIGTSVNYARRWIRFSLGPVTVNFQPSEIAKWVIIFFTAAVGATYENGLRKYFKGFIPACFVIGLVCGLIIIEDFGTAAFTGLLAFIILLVTGVKFWHFLTLAPFGIAALAGAILASEERMKRIEAFLHPEKWASSASYQANQSLIAISSGGLFGKGLGRGITKYGHLPEDTTDFIFAIICEELGFLGAAVVILLFIAFLILGLRVILKCENRFGRLLAGGIVMAISIQAALNIGVVTVVLPTKGIPLPFVSAGGTSLMLSAFAAGVLMNIAKQTVKNEEGLINE